VIVKNLNDQVTEDELKEMFGEVGKVKSARIVWDRNDRSTVLNLSDAGLILLCLLQGGCQCGIL
jgi:RNA recognition motif-containing protein